MTYEHVWEPPTAEELPTLLLLHGTGGDENDLLQFGHALLPGAGLLSPRGNVDENGMSRFFRRLAEGVFDTDDIVRRAGELAEWVRASAGRYAFDPNRVVALGFSNGANIAAAMMLLQPGALRAGALFAPMVPLRPDPLPDLSGTAAFLSAGRRDPIAPPEQAEELARILTDAGGAVKLHWHEGGHELSIDAFRAAQEWLTRLLAATGSPTLP